MAAIDELNSLLESMAEANDGSNHGSEYSFQELPDAESLTLALEKYFSAMSTSISPAVPAREWQIRTMPITETARSIRAAANRWFYELEFSPTVDATVADRALNNFVGLLMEVVAAADVYEVHIVPPMWYECVWQDFAFDDDEKRWFLHFGFSD